jgi:hypothetical protein
MTTRGCVVLKKIVRKAKNLEAGSSISKMNKKMGSKRQKLLTKSFIGLHNTDPHHLPQQGTTHTALHIVKSA